MKSLKVAAVSVAVVVGVGMVSVSSAQATDAPFYGFESGKLNLWDKKNFAKSCHEARSAYDSNFKNDTCGDGKFNDRASSVWNDTNSWWLLYEDINYKGERICIAPQTEDGWLDLDTNFDNRISSVWKMSKTPDFDFCTDVID